MCHLFCWSSGVQVPYVGALGAAWQRSMSALSVGPLGQNSLSVWGHRGAAWQKSMSRPHFSGPLGLAEIHARSSWAILGQATPALDVYVHFSPSHPSREGFSKFVSFEISATSRDKGSQLLLHVLSRWKSSRFHVTRCVNLSRWNTACSRDGFRSETYAC